MEYDLINTIVAAIIAAFIFGMIAKKLKLPAIIGYLIAGVVIGPHTPGITADVSLAQQLAEVGIILLMFGVGLHFSFKDLYKVKKVAVPGALFQIMSATVVGALIALAFGYTSMQGLVFGFSLSVASTIVLLRSLEQKKLLENEGGKIAVGWLIIEDIAIVIAIVLLPVISELKSNDAGMEIDVIAKAIFSVIVKISIFILFMLVVGRRVLPRFLKIVDKLKSAEMRTLSVLSISLGFAYIAYIVFDASFALGAFLSGMVLNESKIGHKSAQSSVSLRDTFSVIFFVSVGMLFNPYTLFNNFFMLLAAIVNVVIVKAIVAYFIARLFKQQEEVCYIVAIGLAQIGEFSFILGGLALSKNLITSEMYNVILASAMISIVINSFMFNSYEKRFIKSKKNS